MYPILRTCPVCGEALLVTRLDCPQCATTIEGRFMTGRLGRLTAEQLAFVEMFLRCDGKIKRVERELGLSYPTVRGRLDDVIRAMGYDVPRDSESEEEVPESLSETDRREILEALEQGNISTEEALMRLRREYTEVE